jgi:predicted Zn-dependent peptidase
MRIIVLVFLILAGSGLHAGNLSFPIEEYHLDNGMMALLIPDHSCPSVTVQVWYKTGSRKDRKVSGRHL